MHGRDAHVAIVRRPHVRAIGHANRAYEVFRRYRPVLAHGKRLSIGDLLQAGLIREGDQWRLSLKGEVIWGRIESNGQLEVSNQSHGNPSKAFQAATGKPGNGWYYWHSRAALVHNSIEG